jgi:cytoskeletal protein CcmA (bactofilin family)
MDISLGKSRTTTPVNGEVHGNLVALVGSGTEFEGTLRAGPGQVSLDAAFKGTATSEGTITIDEHGDVAAELNAKIISISGKLKGTAKATERLEIRSRGVVLGDISTPVLVVEPGGYFDGQCHMPIPEIQRGQVKAPAAQDVAL